MDWTSYLPHDLIKEAYWFNGEAAWKKKAAIEVLDILQKNGYFALGVDIWIPTANGPLIPSRYIYDWDLMASRDDRKIKSARAFIESFRWSEEDRESQKYEPFFLITADKLNG
jgi:hypothetical protein